MVAAAGAADPAVVGVVVEANLTVAVAAEAREVAMVEAVDGAPGADRAVLDAVVERRTNHSLLRVVSCARIENRERRALKSLQ